jgi:hypothetical protein
MTEQEFVRNCLNDICRKNGFDGHAAMTQRDYELISREIENHTGTLISVSTIKRLLQGSFSRLPQTATLNAISAYLGFKNWQEYKASLNKTAGPAIVPDAMQGGAVVKTLPVLPKRLNWKWIALLSVVVVIMVVFSFIGFSSRPVLDAGKAQFTARKTTDNAMPNTVVFNYNIDAVNADSFFIQQSWDVRRRVRIYKNTYTRTDIYYEPGYHIAKLIANDSVIKTIDVSIPTNGWFFLAKEKKEIGLPVYIKPNRDPEQGAIRLEQADLDSNQVSTATEKQFVYLWFPQKLTVNSDNYTLKARLRVKPVRNNQCPFIMCEVFCQRRFMFFKSTSKGCASEALAEFSERWVIGKKEDMSALCTDASQWTDVEVVVKNRQVTIFFNQQKVLATTYTQPSGLITGLGFMSNGLCEVAAAELKGLDGTIVYQHGSMAAPANNTK